MATQPTPLADRRRCPRWLHDHWRRIVLVVVPALLTPIFVYLSPQLRCVFEICVLNCFLLVNEIPAAISALLPVFLVPILGPMSTEEVCAIYFGPSQLYFVSATTIAAAMAESTLARRAALHLLVRLGPSATSLLTAAALGSMIMCFVFNSLVTTLLLLSVVDGVCDELSLVLLDPHIKPLPDARSDTMGEPTRTDKLPTAEITRADSIDTQRASVTDKSVPEGAPVQGRRSSVTAEATGAAPENGAPSPVTRNHREERSSTLYVTAEDSGLMEGNRSAFRQRMREFALLPEGNMHVLKYRQRLRRCLLTAVIYCSTLASTAQLHSPAFNDLLAYMAKEYPEYHVLGRFTFTFYSMPTIFLCTLYLWCYLLRRMKAERAKIRQEERRLPPGVFENRLTLHGHWNFRELSTLAIAIMALVVSAIPKSAWTFVFSRSQVTPETLVLLLSLSLFSLPAQPGTASTAPVLPWAAARARFPWSCMALTACGQVHVVFFQIRARKVNPLMLMLPVTRLASATFSISTSSQNNALLRDCGGLSALDMITIGGQLHIVFAVLELLSILTVGYAMFDLDSFPYWALPNATRTTERI
ncbi:Na(+)/dicarboxylate cotransporter 3-like isoform X2 [Dermacentor andersoni]|uniref:Na(+)/dicarboxylate cotransporter 3-like isoform X2 n=1 Tax=Dermacentor andersoni TaxID=34620 RepID=UPI002416A29C|nr:solute carrier family 13 member 4-like isoform X2 [Dermacentor andersoni]